MKHLKIKYKMKCANSWCKNLVKVTHRGRMYCSDCIRKKAFQSRRLEGFEVSEW